MNLLYGPFRKIKKVKKFLMSFPLKTGFPFPYNKYPETSIQHHVVSRSNYCRFQKLGSKFTSLVYEDNLLVEDLDFGGGGGVSGRKLR